MVDPTKARNIEDRILALAQQGSLRSVFILLRCNGQVTDNDIKAILEGMDTASHTTVTV